MTKPIKLVTTVPFAGFYESKWTGEIDSVEEREAEGMAENEEQDQPVELRLTAEEIGGEFYNFVDYNVVHDKVAKAYVEALDNYLRENTELDISLDFESMTSPREYNFETDRVFCYIRLSHVKAMLKAVDKDIFAKFIKDRFTSRSGFISFYPNDIAEWLAKPIKTWDHNEIGTLLECAINQQCGEDWEWSVYYGMVEGEDIFNAVQEGMNWPKFNEKLAEMRDEKLEALREEDPEFVPTPPRCEHTIDMFGGDNGRV